MTEGIDKSKVAEYREKLRSVNEKRGYFFSSDTAKVDELIEGLLINRERYGYGICPCRLATGDRALDKDIICPCDYRAPDVAEYGACYCELYVSKEWLEGSIPHDNVPERRPQDKVPY
jgi:ferredoxin-thioredoxin reductase catalytic subunit